MNWNSFADFAAMGGYGVYVWGSLGVVFALMAVEVVALNQRWHSVRAELRRMQAARRAQPKGQP